MTHTSASVKPAVARSRGEESASPPHHDALELTRGGDLAEISLHGQVYRLRVTRAGKLILTK